MTNLLIGGIYALLLVAAFVAGWFIGVAMSAKTARKMIDEERRKLKGTEK